MTVPVVKFPLFMCVRVLGILVAALVLIWNIRFRGGLALISEDANLIFNVHPVLMVIGLVLLNGEVRSTHRLSFSVVNIGLGGRYITDISLIGGQPRPDEIPIRSIGRCLGARVHFKGAWKTLSDKGTPTRYIKVIQDMYEGARTCVRTPTGNTKYFPVDKPQRAKWKIGVVEEGSRRQWFTSQQREEKTEYLRCNFSRNENDRNEEEEIRIGEHIIPWIWILCDKKVPLKLKGKFYRVAIRPAMLYGSECWPLTKVQTNRMEVAKMRMLRRTCGNTILDMIPNGVFRTYLRVVNIVYKMREGRLRWFGHVKRRPQSAPVRRVEPLTVNGARRRGRPKLMWEDRLKTNLKELLLSEDMTFDRSEWRTRIRVDEGV
ncbi:hypothetical protein Tco_0032364 [Tanacetum coccineum]